MKKIIIFLLILCCAPFSMLLGASTRLVDAKQPSKNPITVKLISQIVGPEERESRNLEMTSIKYKGTLLLHCPHPAFGGLSDLLVSDDRKTFLAITDMGFWIRGEIKYTPSGFLSGVSPEAQLGQLLNTEGKTFAIKYSADAEALSKAPGSGYYVAYERVHRINLHDSGRTMDLSGPAKEVAIPPSVKTLPENGGIESLLLLPDESLLILSEGDKNNESDTYGAIERNGNWIEFRYVLNDGFHPTSAANLPEGEVVVLERRYKGPGTLGNRLRKFKTDSIKEGAYIKAETILDILHPIPRDNFEGIDAITSPSGKTYIYIISDDNFSPAQHTLLTLFELDSTASK